MWVNHSEWFSHPSQTSDDCSSSNILTATSWQIPSQKHLVKPFPNSWPTEWGKINICVCFKSLSFEVICYTVADNWYLLLKFSCMLYRSAQISFFFFSKIFYLSTQRNVQHILETFTCQNFTLVNVVRFLPFWGKASYVYKVWPSKITNFSKISR